MAAVCPMHRQGNMLHRAVVAKNTSTHTQRTQVAHCTGYGVVLALQKRLLLFSNAIYSSTHRCRNHSATCCTYVTGYRAVTLSRKWPLCRTQDDTLYRSPGVGKQVLAGIHGEFALGLLFAAFEIIKRDFREKECVMGEGGQRQGDALGTVS